MALRQRGLDFTASALGRHLIGWLVFKQGKFADDQKRLLRSQTKGEIRIEVLDPSVRAIMPEDLTMASGLRAYQTFATSADPGQGDEDTSPYATQSDDGAGAPGYGDGYGDGGGEEP